MAENRKINCKVNNTNLKEARPLNFCFEMTLAEIKIKNNNNNNNNNKRRSIYQVVYFKIKKI